MTKHMIQYMVSYFLFKEYTISCGENDFICFSSCEIPPFHLSKLKNPHIWPLLTN